MNGCDYCGRSLYLNEGDTCKGCGAPIQGRAFIYDPAKLHRGFIVRPGVNIPIDLTTLPPSALLTDYLLNAVAPTVRGYYK